MVVHDVGPNEGRLAGLDYQRGRTVDINLDSARDCVHKTSEVLVLDRTGGRLRKLEVVDEERASWNRFESTGRENVGGDSSWWFDGGRRCRTATGDTYGERGHRGECDESDTSKHGVDTS